MANPIENFELILKKYYTKTHLTLYSNNKQQVKQILRPQDVISSVSAQLKAIQVADTVKSKVVHKHLLKNRKSTFMCVNKLPVYEEMHKQTNKFDTQFELNTQLMNIIDNVELIDKHGGVVQEFETSFSHNEAQEKHNEGSEGSPKRSLSKNTSDHDIFCKEDDSKEVQNRHSVEEENICDKEENYTNSIVVYSNSNDAYDGLNKELFDNNTISQLLNECREIDTATDNFTERSPSPVFIMKNVKNKSKSPTPLVFNLDAFEKFESMAISIVENYDFDKARHMINSQIIGKELRIKTDEDVELASKEIDLSPVLKVKCKPHNIITPSHKTINNDSHIDNHPIAHCSKRKYDVTETVDKTAHRQVVLQKTMITSPQSFKDTIMTIENPKHFNETNQNKSITKLNEDKLDFIKILPNTKRKKDVDRGIENPDLIEIEAKLDIANIIESRVKVNSCNNTQFGDEILFSSDEEDDYKKDLPFTCALETSFYNQSDVLDKTMYVGFQTASNRSIQICKDSFDKAKSILSGVESEASVTDLVKICDDNSKIVESKVVSSIKEDENEAKMDPINQETVLNVSFIPDNNNVEVTSDPVLEKYECSSKSEFVITEQNNHDNSKNEQNNNFNGFKTASNKRITLSDTALARCRKVFQDIDLNDNFDIDNETDPKNLAVVEKQEELNTPIEIDFKNTVIRANFGKSFIDIDDNDKEIEELMHTSINDDELIREFENIEMSLEEHKAIIETKTAANENIVSTDQVSTKPKEIFKDDAKVNNSEFQNIDISGCALKANNPIDFGFKTASNKLIKISDKALRDSENMFKDIDCMDIDILKSNTGHNKESFQDRNQPSSSKASFVGFKTANNKEIKISEASLAQTRSIFNDIDSVIIPQKTEKMFDNRCLKNIAKLEGDCDLWNGTNSNKTRTSDINFHGFKTSNNKQINVSKSAILKTKNIFKDIDSNNENENSEVKKVKIMKDQKGDVSNVGGCVGFKTGNNKVIRISEAALAKTNNMYSDIDYTDLIMPKKKNRKKEYPDNNELEDAEIKNGSLGFKTGNNKDIIIPETAFEKTKNIFKDFGGSDVDFNGVNEEKIENAIFDINDTDKNSKPVFQGFKTASNKPVTISEEAIGKTKDLFKDIDNFKMDDENLYMVIENNQGSSFKNKPQEFELTKTKFVPAFRGFQTASNKKVTISKEAIAKTMNLFKDIDKIKIGNEDTNIPKKNSYGSNLKTDKLIFADKTQNYDTSKVESVLSFIGFQTASNKTVSISEAALAKSKKILESIDYKDINEGINIDIPINNIIQPNDVTVEVNKKMKGLQTHNNVVNVFEKASTGSKNIFENIENVYKPSTDNNLDKVKLTESVLEDMSTKYDKTEEVGALGESKKIFHKNSPKRDVDIEINNIINTQVITNFEDTLYTEDFRYSPIKSKRSGSPILSCPRAKKRKMFQTPYSQTVKKNDRDDITVKTDTLIKYQENYKKKTVIKLKDLKELSAKDVNCDPYLLKFDYDSILQFEFSGNRNDFSSIRITIDDIKEIFLQSVNQKLVPNGWLDNHIKLIIWKLISYEIKYRKINVVCTAMNILNQLKYRYDRELYNAERPAIRKILEKDDVPSKTIVLCVVELYEEGIKVSSVTNLTSNIELLLTDGWYCIKATIDRMLAKLVYDGKISVGMKLVTNGAELMNCEQGIAPWEDTSSVRFKLSGNSTRRARWYARLGYHGNAAILSHLSAVKVDGGKVSKLRVFVTRVYPALYVEKFEDGSTVTRSERLEHLHQIKYETERQVMMEKLYEEVEKEFSDMEAQDSDGSYSGGKRSCIDTGTQVAKMMRRSLDPAEFRSRLTASQAQLLETYTSKRREKLLQDVQQKITEKMERNGLTVTRNVVSVLKIRVVGIEEKEGRVEVTKGMLAIWKPNDAILDIVKEEVWIDVINVVPTAIRYSEIHISAGRQSIFSQSKYKEPEQFKPYTSLLRRKCYTIKELSQNPTMITDYNEIDTAGLVFLIDPSMKEFESVKTQFQNVYITDSDKCIVCIHFWGGLKKFGFENVLDTGQVVACGNLQKRAGNTRKSIPQYRVTEFSYFTKTPKNDNSREIANSLNKIFQKLDRRKLCEDCIVLKSNFNVSKQFNNENKSPHNNISWDVSKNRIFLDSPLVKKDDNFNLTGLDFESTFKQTDIQDLPKEVLLRKKRVNEKINKLKMYGEPPPLSPILILNKSKNACNSYKSPLLEAKDSKPDSYVSVAGSKYTPTKEVILNVGDTSSVLNRTYIKCVKPVKLNFNEDNNVCDAVDHFAEEFDSSPPLSLD